MPPPRHLEMSLPNELAETASLVRTGLHRFHGRTVLLTTADGVPFTNGKLFVLDANDGELFPKLSFEFTLRGVALAMEIPLGRVFALAGSWNGNHFVFALPAVDRLWLQTPAEKRTAP